MELEKSTTWNKKNKSNLIFPVCTRIKKVRCANSCDLFPPTDLEEPRNLCCFGWTFLELPPAIQKSIWKVELWASHKWPLRSRELWALTDNCFFWGPSCNMNNWSYCLVVFLHPFWNEKWWYYIWLLCSERKTLYKFNRSSAKPHVWLGYIFKKYYPWRLVIHPHLWGNTNGYLSSKQLSSSD